MLLLAYGRRELSDKNNLLVLKKYYKKFHKQIVERKKEFKKAGKDREDVLKELCFCILTPQSKAEKCWSAVKELFTLGFARLSLPLRKVQNILKHNNVRFHRKKATYLLGAVKNFDNLWRLLNKKRLSDFALREKIAETVKGMGYKEVSHFLRNIGYSFELAILDRHVLKNLQAFGAISEVPKSMTKKEYLEIEKKMVKFSQKLGIPIVDLDLLLWAKETGYVFK